MKTRSVAVSNGIASRPVKSGKRVGSAMTDDARPSHPASTGGMIADFTVHCTCMNPCFDML